MHATRKYIKPENILLHTYRRYEWKNGVHIVKDKDTCMGAPHA